MAKLGASTNAEFTIHTSISRRFTPSSQDERNGNPLHEALVLLFFFILLSFSFVFVLLCNKKNNIPQKYRGKTNSL